MRAYSICCRAQKPKAEQFDFQKNRLRQFGDGFSRCLIHSSSSNVTGSTVKVFFSCCISALLVLSHFGWQLVGPIQHGSTSFLTSYSRGVNERWRRQTNVIRNLPSCTQWSAYTFNNTQYKNRTEINETADFCKTELKTEPKSFFCQLHTPIRKWYSVVFACILCHVPTEALIHSIVDSNLAKIFTVWRVSWNCCYRN